MAGICTPFSEEQVYQNWFLSLTPPKMVVFLALNRKYSHLENSCVALLHLALFYSQDQEMRQIMSFCLRDVLGEVTTI